VGGRLAGVGQRLMESVSKSIIRQGLDALNATLKPAPDESVAERDSISAQAPREAEPSKMAAPSETQFAATVARDVVKDLAGDWITPESMTIWMTGMVAIVAMLAGFWLGRTCRRD
ncbi:MAG: hypothetical protein JXA42_02570, partial [Anaerolineales bacterium]|nr:hypothetical protein [Anaerolineales bacterium]